MGFELTKILVKHLLCHCLIHLATETLLSLREYLDNGTNFSKFLAKMTTRGKILKKFLSHHLSKSKNEIKKYTKTTKMMLQDTPCGGRLFLATPRVNLQQSFYERSSISQLLMVY